METVSESNTDSCLTTEKLEITGIRNRTGASESGNFPHKFTPYESSAC